MPKIKEVVARKIQVKDPTLNRGWTYIGITKSGEEIQLRKKATRKYLYAFEYSRDVGPGKGYAARFTYGQRPGPYVRQYVIKTHLIIEEE